MKQAVDSIPAYLVPTLAHLQAQAPGFGMGRKYVGFPRRFKRVVHVVDSTTIKLAATCMDWAKHRRRKAAAKCHMRLDLQTFLPRFALVKAANTHAATETVELCADIRAGEAGTSLSAGIQPLNHGTATVRPGEKCANTGNGKREHIKHESVLKGGVSGSYGMTVLENLAWAHRLSEAVAPTAAPGCRDAVCAGNPLRKGE